MSEVLSQRLDKRVREILEKYVDKDAAEAVVRLAYYRIGKRITDSLSLAETKDFFERIGVISRIYITGKDPRAAFAVEISALQGVGRASVPAASVSAEALVLIKEEVDIVLARKKAKELCAALHFDHTNEIKIVTAVSEVARNIFRYAGSGSLLLRTISGQRQGIMIEADDNGPGILNIESILAGNYVSKTGMGRGICGCRNLMDEFDIKTAVGYGTHIKMKKFL